MRAVRTHTECPWVLLSIEGWRKAPVQRPDGPLVDRERGTPQGGGGSPLLATLFVHDTGEVWMQPNHPDIPCARYADDAVCHGRTAAHAPGVRQELEQRCAACRLALPPPKTKRVYWKDADRRGHSPQAGFDCLG